MPESNEQISIERTMPAELGTFMNQRQYEIILDYSLAYLARDGKVKSVSDGIIFVESPFNPDLIAECQLFNLARRCKDVPEATWKSVVTSHFDRLQINPSKAKYTFKDLTYARQLIKFIIRPEAAAKQVEGLICRSDIPTTSTYLVLDDDKALQYIRKEEIYEWEKTEEELFKIAFANIAREKINVAKMPIPGGFEFYTIHNENYSTSFLLDLESHAKKTIGKYGSVVAIPTKSMALVFPINLNSPMVFIHTMDKFVQQVHHENDVPISDKYFWYYEGKFEIFPQKSENGKKLIAVPVNLKKLFAQYLN